MVYALREFGYDPEVGTLDRGQAIELRGHVNDTKLLTLRYVAEVPRGRELAECGVCGKLFVDDGTRTAHGDLRHAHRCECGEDFADEPSLEAHRPRCGVAVAAKGQARAAQVAEIAAQPGRDAAG